MEDNELINYKAAKNLKEKLNSDMAEFLRYNPSFEFTGTKKEGRYSFFNSVKNRFFNSISFDFKFSINYEDIYDIYLRNLGKIDKEKYSESELDHIEDDISETVYAESDIEYITIEGLYLRPRGKGIGTEIVKIFIDDVKSIDKLKYIYLFPKDKYAKRFWTRFGFEDVKNLDKRVRLSGKLMVLPLK